MHLNDKAILVVLGSPNDRVGRLSPIAISRAEAALAWYEQMRHRSTVGIILTGGFGAHFNQAPRPHAFYLREFMIRRGLPPGVFMPFVESANTVEDAYLSLCLLSRLRREDSLFVSRMVIVTSDYHLERARFVFQTLFAAESCEVAFEFIGAPTDKESIGFDELVRHEETALAALQNQGGVAISDALRSQGRLVAVAINTIPT